MRIVTDPQNPRNYLTAKNYRYTVCTVWVWCKVSSVSVCSHFYSALLLCLLFLVPVRRMLDLCKCVLVVNFDAFFVELNHVTIHKDVHVHAWH